VGTTSSGLPTIGEVPNDPLTQEFENLGNDFDPGLETLPSEKSVAAAQVPAAPAKQPVVEARSVAAQPATQQVQQPTEQQGASATDTENDQPDSVDSIIDTMSGESANDIIDSITPAFALSDDQIAALEENAPAELPKLLAGAYLRAVTTSLQYMRQIVPQIISQVQSENTIQQQAEQEFFSTFKGLNRNQHGHDIVRYANAFAQNNPGLNRQQLFQLVGTAVMAKYGVTGQAAAPRSTATRQPAFQPASNSAPIVSRTPIDESPFAALGMDFEN
jgi:hypothetical protein